MPGPQTVLYARTIHTLGTAKDVSAIGITDGMISHLGSANEAAGWITANTEVIDYDEAAITPGLVDAHIHPVFGQSVARGVFLGDARTVEETTLQLAEYACTLDSTEIILGHGLNVSIFGASEPSSDFIDSALAGRPAYVTCFDAHSALASKSMLQLAGVLGTETFTDGSSVVVDENGAPTGFLREFAAMALVESVLPPLSIDDKVEAVYRLFTNMAASGLTGGEMLDLADPDSIEIFRRLEARGDLPIKIRIAPWIMASDGPGTLDQMIGLQGAHGRRWHVRGVKLMIDGTIDNGTAWLYEPDAEGESTASLYLNPEQYVQNLRSLNEAGVATTTHAIGDQGIGYVISAIADLPENGLRHRIEHLEEINDEDFARLKDSGATISMQPTHCTHFVRADGTDSWSRRLGEHRSSFAFRLRDVKDAGLVLALGSDWPIAPFDPRLIMADAQTRRRTEVPGSDSAYPRHKLSALEALEGYTVNVHESSGAVGGRIEVGLPADLSIFAADPLAVSPEDLCSLEVLGTYVDGQLVNLGAKLADATVV